MSIAAYGKHDFVRCLSTWQPPCLWWSSLCLRIDVCDHEGSTLVHSFNLYPHSYWLNYLLMIFSGLDIEPKWNWLDILIPIMATSGGLPMRLSRVHDLCTTGCSGSKHHLFRLGWRPSGNDLHYITIENGNFLIVDFDLPGIKMVIFHSYVSLPEGNRTYLKTTILGGCPSHPLKKQML